MSKNIEQIHEFQFNQRLNILKGFKEVSGALPLPIEDLRKSLGDEPLYTVENLEKYTKDVLTKGNENDIQKAKEVLNSLSCREVIDENGYVQNMYFYVEKGHMDFAGSSGGGGRQGLVKKQITDKTGRNTTKWVRANKDDEKQDKTPKAEGDTKLSLIEKLIKQGFSAEEAKKQVGSADDSTSDEEKGSENPKIQEHAKNTSTEDLKAYLQNNPDGEHAEHAKAELAARGEEGSEGDQGIDYNDSEAVKNALASHPDREAIIDSAIENGITPAQALKMHESNKTDHSETHAAIDGAQAALDALKEKTGHPGVSSESTEDEETEESSNSVSQELHDQLYQMIGDISVNNTKNNRLNQDVIDSVYDSMDSGNVDYDKVISILEDYAANDKGATIKEQAIYDLIDKYYDEVDSAPEGDQSGEEPGKTTEDTKDLVNEHKDLVDTLESDSHEDDKKEAVKQKKELKDLEEEQDNDGHDDDGDGKDEDDTSSDDDAKVSKDLEDAFNKIDDVLADENFDLEDAQDSGSDYNKVLNYVADLIENNSITEEKFNEVAKKFKGLDLIYSDFVRD